MVMRFHTPAPIAYHHSRFLVPRFRSEPFAFQLMQKHSALLLLGCVALLISVYLSLPQLVVVPVSSQLVGRWQLQAQIRNGSRMPISGEYEFRSDYSTSKITGNLGTRAGLWIIRTPAGAATSTITATYQFVDTLTHHIFVQPYDQHGAPDAFAWPGPGIYDVAIIDHNQLTLRFPDAKAGGWIVLECSKIVE
jgi:hypothetical protein